MTDPADTMANPKDIKGISKMEFNHLFSRGICFAAALCFVSAPTKAATLEFDFEKCIRITNDIARLECFDNLHAASKQNISGADLLQQYNNDASKMMLVINYTLKLTKTRLQLTTIISIL